MYRQIIFPVLFVVASSLPTPIRAATRAACGLRNGGGAVFTLSIARSFHADVTFKLCRRQDAAMQSLWISAQSAKNSKRWETRQISLDEPTFAKILAFYDKALEYNVKDDALGFDGSSWCLETPRGFTYSKACFWSPPYKAEARNLNGILMLGRELWRISELDPEGLY